MSDLIQRTRLAPKAIMRAFSPLLALVNGQQVLPEDLAPVYEITDLLRETLKKSQEREKIEIVGDSLWYAALSERLIPELYEIKPSRAYRKEHFEACLENVLGQLENFQGIEPRTRFALDFFSRLYSSIAGVRYDRSILSETRLGFAA